MALKPTSTTTFRSDSSEVTQEKMERALNFLATTDAEYAEWVGMVLRTEYMADVAEALAFKSLEGSVEARKQAAKCSDEVKAKKEEHFKAVVARERLRAQRTRANIVIECWRTLEASRRMGNVQ